MLCLCSEILTHLLLKGGKVLRVVFRAVVFWSPGHHFATLLLTSDIVTPVGQGQVVPSSKLLWGSIFGCWLLLFLKLIGVIIS